DGIRVRTVTGVQTCALPISSPAHAKAPPAQSIAARSELPPVQNPRKKVHREKNARAQVPPVQHPRAQDRSAQNAQAPSFLQIFEIGRASCREREESAVAAGS